MVTSSQNTDGHGQTRTSGGGAQGVAEKEPLVAELEEKRRLGAEKWRRLVADTELTLAFLGGNQWVEYPSWGTGLKEVENPTDQIRVTDNRMLPAYRRWMFYHEKEKPVMVAMEGGAELADAESALIATSLCDYWQDACGWKQARKDATGWVGVSGIGFMMPLWKRGRVPKKAKRKTASETPVKTPKGTLSFVVDAEVDRFEGDMAFESLCPLTTYLFPLTAKKWTEVESVMTVSLQTYAWIKMNLKTALGEDELEAADPATFNLEALDRINALVSPQFGYAAQTDDTEKRYEVLQYFERVTPQRPEGRWVVIAGGKVVLEKKLPYAKEALTIDPGDNLNLTMGIIPQVAMTTPGRLIPPSPMGQLREAQIRINDLLTDESRNRKTVGRNKLIVEENQLDEKSWTGEHGEVVVYRPGAGKEAPQLVQGMPLQGISQELSRSYEALDEQTGQTEMLRGQNIAQVRSAFHASIIREEAMTIPFSEISEAEASWQLCAKLALAIAKTRYSRERIIAIAGRDRTGAALTYESADINLDVRVKTGSLIPKNAAIREEKIMNMAQRGIFNDPNTGKPNVRQVLDMLEMGTMNRTVSAEQRHIVRAKEEFVEMLRVGKPILPQEHEDHALHIEQHLADMARPDWYDAEDGRKALVLTHLQATIDMEVARQAPETAMQTEPVAGLMDNAAPGAGAATGPTPPPMPMEKATQGVTA